MQSPPEHTGNPSPTTTLLRHIPVLSLLALVIALAIVGALQAVETITTKSREVSVVAVNQPISTSFGWLTVVQVEKLDGLTSEELGGMTHGVQNLVRSDKAQIQVSVQLVNQSTSIIDYSPAHFTLHSEDGQTGVEPTSGTLHGGQLPAHATINAEVDFVAPRTNRQLWVEYYDPGRPQQLVRIAIGPADPTAGANPIPPEEEHPHADE